jgi:hypothetical protein
MGGAVGFLAIAACHTMQPITPSQLISTPVARIWVTGADQSTIVLHGPRLNGDTLGGFVDGKYREMLLSDTRAIQQRAAAPGRTAMVGAVAGAVALVSFVYFANRSYVGDGQTCYIRDGVVVPCCAGKSTVSCG